MIGKKISGLNLLRLDILHLEEKTVAKEAPQVKSAVFAPLIQEIKLKKKLKVYLSLKMLRNQAILKINNH
ncbi:MAG: hypothetical protein ACR5KV_00120 [Wolbachia sp.]